MNLTRTALSTLALALSAAMAIPGYGQEGPDLAATYEDLVVEQGDIEPRIEAFLSLVASGGEGHPGMTLREAVWDLEASVNYTFRGQPRAPKNLDSVRGSFSLGLPKEGGEEELVSTKDVVRAFGEIVQSIDDRISDTRESVLIFNGWVETTHEAAHLVYEVTLASGAESAPPPLGAGDFWKACNGGHCGGGNPPVSASGAEERLEQIFNYQYNSQITLPSGGTPPNTWTTLCAQGTFPFFTHSYQTQYDPTMPQIGGTPWAADYNSGDLFHDYNTSSCRNLTQMLAHEAFLATLASSYGWFGPCPGNNFSCTHFQYLDIQKTLFLPNHFGYANFNYFQNAWVYQWRPIFHYGKLYCPGLSA